MAVYDVRSNLEGGPVLEFGHKDSSRSSSVRSRRRRGDILTNYFVRGYDDGTIQLFDLRQAAVSSPC